VKFTSSTVIIVNLINHLVPNSLSFIEVHTQHCDDLQEDRRLVP